MGMRKKLGGVVFAAVAIFATVGARAEEEEGRKWLSLHAYADVESAYICRGYVWNVRPYSAQFVDGEIDLGAFGRFARFLSPLYRGGAQCGMTWTNKIKGFLIYPLAKCRKNW